MQKNRGEHIHHGYFLSPGDTKEEAQIRLIDLLLERSKLAKGSIILDVGCGIGGTARRLARHYDCIVVGITISGRQVEIAQKLTLEEAEGEVADAEGFVKLGNGKIRFLELDAEKMGDFFTTKPNQANFDCIWVLEAMSHLPNKELFFQNTELLLKRGGRLVVADCFKAEGLSSEQLDADIKPIEGESLTTFQVRFTYSKKGIILPPLCSQAECVGFGERARLAVSSYPLDISDRVSKTWYVSLLLRYIKNHKCEVLNELRDFSWSLILSSAFRALAVAQGKNGLAFLRAFKAMRSASSGLAFLRALGAMRRGFANGTFRYAVMVFQKK
jgi:tocopherol O-methyltransferase